MGYLFEAHRFLLVIRFYSSLRSSLRLRLGFTTGSRRTVRNLYDVRLMTILFIIVLPICMSLLVTWITRDTYDVVKTSCPPHTWSRDILSDELVCMECNFISDISRNFNN